jgi:DNA modification methylase
MTWKNRITRAGKEDPRKVSPNPRNWRKHPKKQAAGLLGALEEVGWVQDVIVNERTGHLVDGHLRVELAIQNNEKSVPVKYVDLSEEEEALILATLDPITAMAEADKDRLKELLTTIETESESLKELLGNIGKDFKIPIPQDEGAEPQIDRAAELMKEWGTESGQLWQLGPHRILCGDATNKDDVERLLAGNIPLLMVTDPPYGVQYDPNWRNEAAAKGSLSYAASRIGQVKNDDRIDWSDAYRLFPGDVAYIWSPGGDHIIITGKSIQDAGYQIRAQLIWKKQHIPISRGHYCYQHEPCWYAVKKGRKSNWIGDRMSSSVWDIPLDKNVEGGHSTQKPFECMARPIRNHDGDVYDPFLGSGTTLIACEKLDRICYGMEIAPEYIAVTLQRYKDTTGKDPELVA